MTDSVILKKYAEHYSDTIHLRDGRAISHLFVNAMDWLNDFVPSPPKYLLIMEVAEFEQKWEIQMDERLLTAYRWCIFEDTLLWGRDFWLDGVNNVQLVNRWRQNVVLLQYCNFIRVYRSTCEFQMRRRFAFSYQDRNSFVFLPWLESSLAWNY